MDITISTRQGFELIIEAQNVRIVEDIEIREYFRDESGKTDYGIPPKRDISTDAISQFVSALDNLIHYRIADYDSSDLIENLFEKLPQEKAISLLVKMTTKLD